MKLITLTKGYECMVDDEDYQILSQYKWYAKKSRNNFYAARTENVSNLIKKTIWMHRSILDIKETKLLVDHINLNSLDNRKDNLRKCTIGENRLNCPVRKDSRTGLKGVFRLRASKNYYAQIRINGEIINLGSFNNSEDAKHAYNNAALKFHGEFARLN